MTAIFSQAIDSILHRKNSTMPTIGFVELAVILLIVSTTLLMAVIAILFLVFKKK